MNKLEKEFIKLFCSCTITCSHNDILKDTEYSLDFIEKTPMIIFNWTIQKIKEAIESIELEITDKHCGESFQMGYEQAFLDLRKIKQQKIKELE